VKHPDEDHWILSPSSVIDRSTLNFAFGPEVAAGDDLWQWPSEISNTMEWSAQFLGGGQPLESPPAMSSTSEKAHGTPEAEADIE
jgi:hypothetical protein